MAEYDRFAILNFTADLANTYAEFLWHQVTSSEVPVPPIGSAYLEAVPPHLHHPEMAGHPAVLLSVRFEVAEIRDVLLTKYRDRLGLVVPDERLETVTCSVPIWLTAPPIQTRR